MNKVRKTIYISEACLAKVDKEVRLEIYQGKNTSISKKLSDIIEAKYRVNAVSKAIQTTRPIVDMAVLGNEFTSKDLQKLYVGHGLNKRSAEVKIARLKKEGKLVVVGKGKYKLL